MSNIHNTSGVPLPLSPESSPSDGAGSGSGAFWWLFGCHGFLFNLASIGASAIFVAYLASRSRRSYMKLSYGRSSVMIAYYVFVWIVCVLNFFWCLLQALQCNPAKRFSWDTLSLFTKSGMLFLEISLLAFLFQGNEASGPESPDTLERSLVTSGFIVATDILLKVIYVFGFGVPLFVNDHKKRDSVKWGLWIFYELLLSAVYGIILYMHHSKWRERLPARPAFYNYICAMFLLNLISLFACVLAGNGAWLGFWLFDLTTVCYHSLYLPLLYVTFLADFFQDEDLRLENVYYSEMRDAGFFDADWD